MSTQLTTRHEPAAKAISVFSSEESFESALRLIKPLSQSNMVPKQYQGPDGMGNALIALDMANRMNISPIVVMQNLNVIEGRPSWSSTFIIGALGSCGLFSPIRWKIRDLGDVDAEKIDWVGEKGSRQKKISKFKIRDKEFIATAIEKETGEILEGPPVTFSMAIAEGWYHRAGSKWLTMPDLMGRYRAAAFFGRLYAPHITNGMPMEDEVVDITDYRLVAEASTPEVLTPEKPAGRASGVHAAMNSGTNKRPTKAEKDAEQRQRAREQAEEAEAQTVPNGVDDLQTSGSGNDDMFGSPEEDDDYQPQ